MVGGTPTYMQVHMHIVCGGEKVGVHHAQGGGG